MRKILMFVGTFAVIFMLAACGNGVQKKTSEKYSAAEVEQAGQVMKYYNTSLALLKNLVLDIDYNDAVVVIHTSPGAAQLIARLLDSLGKAEGILGTIAGDDTIFTTPANGFTVKDLYEAILELFDQEL